MTNLPPAANAGSDQVVNVNSLVTLDGTASLDPEGYPLRSFHWTQSGGAVVSFTPGLSMTTFIAPATPTVLTFTLTVTDINYLVDTDPIVITVLEESYRLFFACYY